MRERAREGRPGEDASDSEVNEVVERLRQIDCSTGWQRTLAIGELIVGAFFDGCVQQLQKVRTARQSLRRLAAHELCPLRKSALAEALAVYAFVSEYPEVRSFANLAPGHVAVVLKCEPEQRLELLRAAQEDRRSVRELAKQVSFVRKRQSASLVSAAALDATRRAEERLQAVRELVSESEDWLSEDITKARELIEQLDGLASSALTAVANLRLGSSR